MPSNFLIFALFFFFFQCRSVEFIPEPDYSSFDPRYPKKSWEEVEIRRTRPEAPFQILGEIRYKSYESSGLSEPAIKQELFRKKLDGVWIVSKSQETQDGLGFETMDSRGNVTNSYKSKDEIPVWRGFAYRYKRERR